jgi:hypothetical protein
MWALLITFLSSRCVVNFILMKFHLLIFLLSLAVGIICVGKHMKVGPKLLSVGPMNLNRCCGYVTVGWYKLWWDGCLAVLCYLWLCLIASVK